MMLYVLTCYMDYGSGADCSLLETAIRCVRSQTCCPFQGIVRTGDHKAYQNVVNVLLATYRSYHWSLASDTMLWNIVHGPT